MKKWIYVYLFIVFAVLTWGICLHKVRMPVHEIIVPGTVVDYEVRQSRNSKGRRSTTYAEVISFELNGGTHRFARGMSASWKPKIGRVRNVAVDPAHPANARVRMWTWVETLMPYTLKQYPVILFFWVMGCAFFGVGWFLSLSYYEFFRRAILVRGQVTSYRERRGGKGGTSYYEVVSFDFDGQTRTVEGNVGGPFKPKMGTVREVGVDPQNIQKARVRSGVWFGIIFALVGLGLWASILVADKFH